MMFIDSGVLLLLLLMLMMIMIMTMTMDYSVQKPVHWQWCTAVDCSHLCIPPHTPFRTWGRFRFLVHGDDESYFCENSCLFFCHVQLILSAIHWTCCQIIFFALFIPSFDTFCWFIKGAILYACTQGRLIFSLGRDYVFRHVYIVFPPLPLPGHHHQEMCPRRLFRRDLCFKQTFA